MKNYTLLTFLSLFLASCAGQQLRLSTGAGLVNAHGDTSTARAGIAYKARAELTGKTDFEDIYLGVYGDGGLSEDFNNSAMEIEHAEGGLVARKVLTETTIAPFVELRAGYRHAWIGGGEESGMGAGAGLGVEAGPAFLMIDYSAGFFGSLRTEDIGLVVGSKINF